MRTHENQKTIQNAVKSRLKRHFGNIFWEKREFCEAKTVFHTEQFSLFSMIKDTLVKR